MSQENPFLHQGVLNAPLTLQLCQEIHAWALQYAVRQGAPELVPETVALSDLRHCVWRYGSGCCIYEAGSVRQIFLGVTLAVYQAIERLYCLRLRRSARMVWRILQSMAQQAGGAGITYEAVWAICLYLTRKHEAATEVTRVTGESSWWLASLQPDVHLQRDQGAPYRPLILCVVEPEPLRVLAFRIARPENLEEGVGLVLYDALVAQRYPAREGSAGVCWRFPTTLVSTMEISQHWQASCVALLLSLQYAQGCSLSKLKALEDLWAGDLSSRCLPERYFAFLVDTYLAKVHGYGPLRNQQEQERRFARLTGYTRDPLEQFPALGHLLPHVPSHIEADGSIGNAGLHYTDELLTYWPGCPVELCLSPAAEALAWVYLEGELLCQARARELRRQDGTYRLNRLGR